MPESEKIELASITDVARYATLKLISNGNSISPLKLQKLLYYMQAWHMVYFGKNNTLFQDKPQAWINGPVYRKIYDTYKQLPMYDQIYGIEVGCKSNNNNDILQELEKAYNALNLSKNQLAFLESVITTYGSFSHDKLVFLTHSETPWSEAREGLSPIEPSDKEISLDTMCSFYTKRKERVNSTAKA